MTIGARRYSAPPPLARGAHHPDAALRSLALVQPLTMAYSYAQHVGQRLGEWWAPIHPERLYSRTGAAGTAALGVRVSRILAPQWDTVEASMVIALGPSALAARYDLVATVGSTTATVASVSLDPADPDFAPDELAEGLPVQGLWVVEGSLDISAEPRGAEVVCECTLTDPFNAVDIIPVGATMWATTRGAAEP